MLDSVLLWVRRGRGLKCENICVKVIKCDPEEPSVYGNVTGNQAFRKPKFWNLIPLRAGCGFLQKTTTQQTRISQHIYIYICDYIYTK